MRFNFAQQTLFLLIYGFLAWAAETVYFAVRERKYVNPGLLSMPIDFGVGVVFANLAVVLPTLGRNYFGMYLIALANLVIVRAVLGFFRGRLAGNIRLQAGAPSGTLRGVLRCVALAAAILLIYLLLQPVLMLLAELLPARLLTVVAIVFWALVAVDLVTSVLAVRRGAAGRLERLERERADRLSTRITGFVWRRLERAYPGIRDEGKRSEVVFARGMSLDKIVWVFLISALLGDIIETFYCRLVGGTWMSRSSVIFGPFSFVWGIGAVVLTVSLMRLKDKNDRWVLLAGAILGGAFEYMCSVFTEIAFGKVFWDYSDMPLNIGGRTNVLFMFFWGILGLVWVKIAYPPLDKLIERFPPVAAKVLTWLIIALMSLNGLLTVAVMQRYNTRKERPEPANILEEFIDETYDDAFVEHRWQNMVSAEGGEEEAEESGEAEAAEGTEAGLSQ